MNNQQSLNVRQAVNPEINSPSLRITANPVSTAVQAVDTSRQYLGSSNAIAQSIVDFGKTLGNFGGHLSSQNLQDAKTAYSEREYLKDKTLPLELLKAQNLALQSAKTPGITLGEQFNIDAPTLGNSLNKERVLMGWGEAAGTHLLANFPEKIVADWENEQDGFQKGNSKNNLKILNSKFAHFISQAEGLPDEYAKQSALNVILKSKDKVTAHFQSLDNAIAEKKIDGVLQDSYAKLLTNFTSSNDEETARNALTSLEHLGDQLGKNKAFLAQSIYKGVTESVGAGTMTAEEAMKLMGLTTTDGTKLRELVTDEPTMRATLTEKENNRKEQIAIDIDKSNAMKISSIVNFGIEEIINAPDMSSVERAYRQTLNDILPNIASISKQAEVFTTLTTAKRTQENKFKNQQQKQLVKLENEVAKQQVALHSVEERSKNMRNGATPFTAESVRALINQIKKTTTEPMSEEYAWEIASKNYGIPNLQLVNGLQFTLESISRSPDTIQQNVDSVISQVTKIVVDVSNDEDKRNLFLTHITEPDGSYTNKHALLGALFDAVQENPNMLKNPKEMSAMLSEISRSEKLDTEIYKKVRDTAYQSIGTEDDELTFKKWLDTPQTKAFASRFSGEDSSSIAKKLVSYYKNTHTVVLGKAIPNNLLKRMTKQTDLNKASESFTAMLKNHASRAWLLNAVTSSESVLPTEVRDSPEALNKFIEGTGENVLKTSHLEVFPSTQEVALYDTDGLPIGQRVSYKTLSAIDNWGEEKSKDVQKALEILNGTTNALKSENFNYLSKGTEDMLTDTVYALKSLRSMTPEERLVYTQEASDGKLKDAEEMLKSAFKELLSQRSNDTLITLSEFNRKVQFNTDTKTLLNQISSLPINKTYNSISYDPSKSRFNSSTYEKHIKASVEKYTSSIEYGEKGLSAYNILMDTALGVAPLGKEEKRIGDFFTENGDFIDTDSDGIFREALSSSVYREVVNALKKDTSATLNVINNESVRNVTYTARAKKVDAWLLRKDVSEKELGEFTKNSPDKYGALVALYSLTGKNFESVMDSILKKDAVDLNVVAGQFSGNKSIADKRKALDNILLMLKGGFGTWKGFHLNESSVPPAPPTASALPTFL